MRKELTLDAVMGKIHVNPTTQCWEWTGARDKDGYGVVTVSRKSKRLHRLLFELYYGYIDDDLVMCHECDNPPCCNPEHLFQGTIQDNSDDMVAKGRSLKGERNANTALRQEEAEEIRKMYAEGMKQREIAEMYGMTQQAISSIVNGINWKE